MAGPHYRDAGKSLARTQQKPGRCGGQEWLTKTVNRSVLQSRNQDVRRPNLRHCCSEVTAIPCSSGYLRGRISVLSLWENTMKKIVIAVTALAMGSMSASAADLAARPYTKAPWRRSPSTTGAVSISAVTSVAPGPTRSGSIPPTPSPAALLVISGPARASASAERASSVVAMRATTGKPATSCSVSRAPFRASTTAAPCSTPSSAPEMTCSPGVPTGWRRLPAVPVSRSITTCSTSRAATPA